MRQVAAVDRLLTFLNEPIELLARGLIDRIGFAREGAEREREEKRQHELAPTGVGAFGHHRVTERNPEKTRDRSARRVRKALRPSAGKPRLGYRPRVRAARTGSLVAIRSPVTARIFRHGLGSRPRSR